MKLYKDVLAKGWKLTSNNRWLWFFGFFALLINGNGGEYDFYFKNVDRLVQKGSPLSPDFWQTGQWELMLDKIVGLWQTNGIVASLLGLIFLISLCVVIYFAVISQMSLIYAAGHKTPASLDFSKCLKQGNKHFVSAMAVNLITKVLLFLILFLIAIPVFKIIIETNNESYQSIYVLLGLFVLIPVALIVAFINKYALNYIVLENKHIGPALVKAFKLFINNWLVSLEMAFIIFLMSFLLGVFIIVGTGVLIAPFLGVAMYDISLFDSAANTYTIIMLGAIIMILFMGVAATIFSCWQWTSWTYLFQELTKENKEGKLVRVFKK